MSRLTDLIASVKAKDPQLGADLDREFKVLSTRLPFGLNFERHRPEAVELPLCPVRKGDKVRVLPPRGSGKKADVRLWRVLAILRPEKSAVIELLGTEVPEQQTISLTDLVIVAEFRDKIYPGLKSTSQITCDANKPYHAVINAENYHALRALTFTHRGKIDLVYVDPPYNSGAKDWKYNNDYVEGDDLYRHSKWLAFIERRLVIARELMKPENSALIITIDAREYLRLGMLLEQTFPEAKIQMISTIINPKGVSDTGGFRRADEYVFFVMLGDSSPARLPLTDEWSASANISGKYYAKLERNNSEEKAKKQEPAWTSMMRRGTNSMRQDRPFMFYPIYVDPDTRQIVNIGNTIPEGQHSAPEKSGLVTVLPIRSNGEEGYWQVSAAELKNRLNQGRVRLGRKTSYGYVVNYLPDGAYRDVMSDAYTVEGRADDGSLIAYRKNDENSSIAPTQWKIASHNASEHGSALISKLLPGRKFPFPKSLYAVEDCLKFFVFKNKNAVVLDFFAGSGTTTHAVMRLNRQDAGKRQSISVTNNEVAAAEQSSLSSQGLRPGDSEWEKLGICEYITKPRVEAAILGKTPNGNIIKGNYGFNEEFPIGEGLNENAEFFSLTYETKDAVNYNLAFERVAPLLWLRAGAFGSRIDKLPQSGWAVADTYGLLADVDRATPFIEAVHKAEGVKIVYIVTDDDRRFQAAAHRLPKGVEPVRLYEAYLKNFSFVNGE